MSTCKLEMEFLSSAPFADNLPTWHRPTSLVCFTPLILYLCFALPPIRLTVVTMKLSFNGLSRPLDDSGNPEDLSLNFTAADGGKILYRICDFGTQSEHFGVAQMVDLAPKGGSIPFMRDNKLEYILRVSHYRPQSNLYSRATDFSTRNGSNNLRRRTNYGGCTAPLDIAKEQDMFLVLDVDGLYMAGQQLDIVRGYRRAVLTPNVVEFKRLSEQVGIDPNTPPEEHASSVSKAPGGVTILQKGRSDVIATNTEGEQTEVVVVDTPGGMKRCGGQGDILSGSVGAFLAWAKCYEWAFEKGGRSVVTQDMLKEIGGAFAKIFGSMNQSIPLSSGDNESHSSAVSVKKIPTKPIDGLNIWPAQEHYTENFVQSIFDAVPLSGSTLVIGGDGRFYSPEVVQIILKIASANDISKVIIGKDGILSTPATSNIICKYKANGGILLTASHNPGGPNADFGIKYNVDNGGPAPEGITEKIFARTKTISSYKVSIIDSVKNYPELLEAIFDFGLIKSFLTSHKSDFKVLFDGLHASPGRTRRRFFLILWTSQSRPSRTVSLLPISAEDTQTPISRMHSAHSLVEAVERGKISFGAASDGDGDRNMIYGVGAFVTLADSVAIIADWAEVIPYFKKGGVKGLARSMPTSAAIDLVAKSKGLEYFEVPTGWKFFGNLMDAGRLSICGEESFGTGFDHIREKDGCLFVTTLWLGCSATDILGTAWLNIIAAANEQDKSGKLWGIREILNRHYAKYGRSFFSRYDYEEVPSEGAQKLVDHVNELIKSSSFSGKLYTSSATGTSFTVGNAYNFDYTDPIDKSVSKNQGQVVTFSDGSRVVWRLSGTGSQGATVLIDVALEISNLKQFLGREQPTVITVSALPLFSLRREDYIDRMSCQ
ncbi:hypothetical protein BJY52DRAFT_1226492 [Lactarius psammicola]|nr:hypothetical protein BJY52DRAFT_1226492 [Lactarius psammicola]